VTVRAALVVALLSVIGGCKRSDLNQPCLLFKPNPDGGAPVYLLESEVRAKLGQSHDVLSLNSPDCDEACVRDSSVVSDAGASDPAYGYCSATCREGAACPSADSALDRGNTRLSCRPLLDALATDNTAKPFFCARGAGL
jgi:hypothetical protein